jgi:hypothetical protein
MKNGEANYDVYSAAFDKVKNKTNWKLPIKSKVPPNTDVHVLIDAIAYFTGSHAEIHTTDRGKIVVAPGYYAVMGA